jgi:hypothetical protein
MCLSWWCDSPQYFAMLYTFLHTTPHRITALLGHAKLDNLKQISSLRLPKRSWPIVVEVCVLAETVR